jgi:hypothetical protein
MAAAGLPRNVLRNDLDYALAARCFDFGAHHRNGATGVNQA